VFFAAYAAYSVNVRDLLDAAACERRDHARSRQPTARKAGKADLPDERHADTVILFSKSVSPVAMIHPAHQFPALAAVGPKDASFLGSLLHDVLRSARHARSARIDVQEYAVEAHCSSLGAALVAVSWAVSRHGVRIASDTVIQRRSNSRFPR